MKCDFTLPNGNLVSLHRRDCILGLGEIKAPISAVVTSPPYNIGTEYNRYDDRRPEKEYLAWLERIFGMVYERLAEDGSVFVNVGYRPSDPEFPFRVADTIGRYFKMQNVIQWVKSISIETVETWSNSSGEPLFSIPLVETHGHFKPINSDRYLNGCHEYIFHFTLKGDVKLDRLAIGVPYVDKSNLSRGTRGKNGDVRCRGNVWFIPYETIRSRKLQRPHPAPFPLELPKQCLKLHGLKKQGLVVDPFMGLGTTAVACAQLGLPFAGFEIDDEYFKFATKWVEQEVSSDKE